MRKLIVLLVAFCMASMCFAQKNVQSREIVKRDTINGTGFVSVEEYQTRNGNMAFRAKWCGKSINISRKTAENVLEGSDPMVVLCYYNNGEVIRQKVITLND